eukprot:COSAG05_NODE_271_length_12468_cov_8.607810_12_plen_91_part_00
MRLPRGRRHWHTRRPPSLRRLRWRSRDPVHHRGLHQPAHSSDEVPAVSACFACMARRGLRPAARAAPTCMGSNTLKHERTVQIFYFRIDQ